MVEILRARTDTAVRLDYFLSICLLPLSLFRIQLTFVLSFSLSLQLFVHSTTVLHRIVAMNVLR